MKVVEQCCFQLQHAVTDFSSMAEPESDAQPDQVVKVKVLLHSVKKPLLVFGFGTN